MQTLSVNIFYIQIIFSYCASFARVVIVDNICYCLLRYSDYVFERGVWCKCY